ncbi:hypothetical protein BaRGS_00030757 [Batillaria attramentaria]|uniref:Immunoglobulin domain-containing protein n=1 Tax=Batillaria attramentaria TaxID=370345 RepID=A0ABD0JTM4_9CAEN
MVRKLVVALLLVLISPMQAQVLKAWCQDITAVVGKSANISCTFSETVSRMERPFLVVKVPLDSKDFPDDVVDCTNGYCTVSDGYTYTEQAGSQQVIEIPSVEKRLEGRYQCQFDTREPQDAKSCTLLVQEANLETGGETQENNVLVTTEGPSGDSEGNGFLVPVVISIVLLSVVAILVISLLLWKRQRPKRSQRLAKEDNDFADITASETPLNPTHACTFNTHGEDGSCVDHCQKHAGTEEEEEGTESEAVSWLNSAHQNPRFRSSFTAGQANEEQHTLLASDTRTDNCREHVRNEKESSVDGFPDNKCSIPATPPAYSVGIADNPQQKVVIATDEDSSRNSACANWRQTQTRHMPDLGMGIQELPSKHGVMLLTAQTKAGLGGIVDAHYLFHYSGMTRQE